MRLLFILFMLCLLTAPPVLGQERKIVVGPKNIDLADGAEALLAGDVERGIELTVSGLRQAANRNERLTGTSNLCAGYIMLGKYDDALEQCSKVLAEDEEHWRARTNRALIYTLEGRYAEADADLVLAEKVAPRARTVVGVRNLLDELMSPVEPIVIIDDRRQ